MKVKQVKHKGVKAYIGETKMLCHDTIQHKSFSYDG